MIAFGGAAGIGVVFLHRAEHRAARAGARRPASSCGGGAATLRAQPVPEDGVRAGPWSAPSSSARSSPIVPWRSATTSWSWIVSRLTWRERTKSSSSSCRQVVEDALERDAHRVLDEARLQVRVLDDEQLVGPLEELVDRRAHRALDDLDEPLGVEALRGADEERAAAALVVRRERDELEDPLDVAAVEARLEQPVGRRAADEALRAGAGVDPGRLDADDAPDAARATRRRSRSARPSPASRAPSPASRARTGSARRSAPRRGSAPCRSTTRRATCSASSSTRSASSDPRRPRSPPRRARGSGTCGRPSGRGSRSTVQSIVGGDQLLAATVADADRLLDAGDADAREAERDLGRRRLQIRCPRCAPSG